MKQRGEFTKALLALQQDILKMGSLVEEIVAQAVKSLEAQDLQLVAEVFILEKQIDQLELEIEDHCLRLIATQQPMAKDLRKIASAFKIVHDLERMGDHAVDIAKVTQKIGAEPLIKPLIDLPRMALTAQQMIKDALDAYVAEDMAQAETVGQADDTVDSLHQQIFRELLLMMMEKPRVITQATYLLFVSSSLERIADYATNISESVIYLVSGRRLDLNQ
ncbi:MAG TPA: phosphate signaling complex protein PhoU [Oscillospiraceae bacterium]|nr:phosphate signaling complex protein PhoU [Oscillospiraceae bacterium]